MLSGYDIVAKGATKIEVALPELGVKEVYPNKTWLEGKQIQSAIEGRKRLIEVERIDKSGSLSHAMWQEDLMLAEVTQKVGGYWQYLGHVAGKKLYLNPEEALFLLETNSLYLKHNDVKVSLQQAYTLLLRDNVKLLQYKVYASLSRIGYRVYRHTIPENSTSEEKIEVQIERNNVKTPNEKDVGNKSSEQNTNSNNFNLTKPLPEDCVLTNQHMTENSSIDIQASHEEFTDKITNHKRVNSLKKLKMLKNRQLKPCNVQIIVKYLEILPDLLQKEIVMVKAPGRHLIPNTINLTKLVYKVNLLNIDKKEISVRSSSNESNMYTVNDEVNESHIRSLRNASTGFASHTWANATNARFINYSTQFRYPFGYWRRQQPFHFYNFNMMFQRPHFYNWYPIPNFNVRAQSNYWRPHLYNINNRSINRNRMRKNAKKRHLNGIHKLAARLKQLVVSGITDQENIYSLLKLIQSYNTRYKAKVRLDERFDIVVDEMIVDTITVDDDDGEGPSCKRHKSNPVFEDNLNNLKLFGQRLKDLEINYKSSGRHRRAFSKLLKTFNESYNEEYYLNEDYEIESRNLIEVDTSDSDLECIEKEAPSVSGKKLKNPFNVLKRLSETQKAPLFDETRNTNEDRVTVKEYNEVTLNTFSKGWLPSDDNFGRAEVISKTCYNNDITDIRREEFLYDFIKTQTHKYHNWLDLKKAFYNCIQATIVEFQDTMPHRSKVGLDSIVKPEDCANMSSILKKLSIINCDKAVAIECHLAIDFDVYNRDVQNFRKSNRPTPHFRIICIEESTNLPPGNQIAALHSKYSDKVTIVFAIVGIDSISYIQINPTDLPVHISNKASYVL